MLSAHRPYEVTAAYQAAVKDAGGVAQFAAIPAMCDE